VCSNDETLVPPSKYHSALLSHKLLNLAIIGPTQNRDITKTIIDTFFDIQATYSSMLIGMMNVKALCIFMERSANNAAHK